MTFKWIRSYFYFSFFMNCLGHISGSHCKFHVTRHCFSCFSVSSRELQMLLFLHGLLSSLLSHPFPWSFTSIQCKWCALLGAGRRTLARP
uniref:Putative secreted protein n=1 Tax=Amblyomma cajennense TaxID=34607 RepID=A0A023FBS7_AMBCJ